MYMSNYYQGTSYPANRTNGRPAARSRSHHKVFFRLAMLILLILFCFFCGTLMNVYAGSSSEEEPASEIRTVDVVRGDTLWSIASEYKSANQDIRDYISKLKRINGLESSLLHEGQMLVLP